MRTTLDRDDGAMIDVDDEYTDGDGLRWFVISVNVDAGSVNLGCRNPPRKTIPIFDLEKMDHDVSGEDREHEAGAVVDASGLYVDGDELSWRVSAVNLRDRTVTLSLLNPPGRTIPIAQLRNMKSRNRQAEQDAKALHQAIEDLGSKFPVAPKPE